MYFRNYVIRSSKLSLHLGCFPAANWDYGIPWLSYHFRLEQYKIKIYIQHVKGHKIMHILRYTRMKIVFLLSKSGLLRKEIITLRFLPHVIKCYTLANWSRSYLGNMSHANFDEFKYIFGKKLPFKSKGVIFKVNASLYNIGNSGNYGLECQRHRNWHAKFNRVSKNTEGIMRCCKQWLQKKYSSLFHQSVRDQSKTLRMQIFLYVSTAGLLGLFWTWEFTATVTEDSRL